MAAILGSENVVWDLTPLYRGINDENIEKDIEIIKNRVASFSTKYRGKLKDLSSSELLTSVTELEDISQKTARMGSFAYLNFATQANNAASSAFLQKFHETASQFQRDLLFFELLTSTKTGDLMRAKREYGYR